MEGEKCVLVFPKIPNSLQTGPNRHKELQIPMGPQVARSYISGDAAYYIIIIISLNSRSRSHTIPEPGPPQSGRARPDPSRAEPGRAGPSRAETSRARARAEDLKAQPGFLGSSKVTFFPSGILRPSSSKTKVFTMNYALL